MLTKADYIDYLHLLGEKERNIISVLQDLLERVSDKAVAETLQNLVREKHEACEAVTRLFESLFGLHGEQRRYKRSPALGDVKLRNLETGETIACRCLDISLGGLCVQSASLLPSDVLLALEVRFFESRRSIVRRARVRWCTRTDSGRYRAGLQFETCQTAPSGETISGEE